MYKTNVNNGITLKDLNYFLNYRKLYEIVLFTMENLPIVFLNIRKYLINTVFHATRPS